MYKRIICGCFVLLLALITCIDYSLAASNTSNNIAELQKAAEQGDVFAQTALKPAKAQKKQRASVTPQR